MSARSITTSRESVTCDVCGRRLLPGERADVFLAGGERRHVCELCAARAAHEGWIREGADDALGVRPRADRGSLLGRLRQRREEATRAPRRGTADADEVHAPANGHRVPEAPVPAARHVHAVPTNADLKASRAVEVFNASPYPRTVAGVARSLGPPFAVVRPASGSGSAVSILLGWELCWYRYQVDLADEAAGVRLDAQGDSLDELLDEDRQPNAATTEDGELILVAG